MFQILRMRTPVRLCNLQHAAAKGADARTALGTLKTVKKFLVVFRYLKKSKFKRGINGARIHKRPRRSEVGGRQSRFSGGRGD